jgi:two-component system response regulator FlrC
VDRIGGRKPIPVDVRIIATTNRNLSDCVKEGSFREDLFYRLNVVNLTLPPLRERIGDVKHLSSFFIQNYAVKNGKTISGISDEALALMDSHTFPGNIRELENVVERAVITAQEDSIRACDIHIDRRGGDLSASAAFAASGALAMGTEVLAAKSWEPGRTLDDIERNVILEALKYHSGNRTHTAKALGISIRTLRNKLADYRLLGIQA